jgi:hypothetical protein
VLSRSRVVLYAAGSYEGARHISIDEYSYVDHDLADIQEQCREDHSELRMQVNMRMPGTFPSVGAVRS